MGIACFQNPESRFVSVMYSLTADAKYLVFINIFFRSLQKFGLSKTLS